MDQRTDEWYAARLGKVTASRIADAVAKTRSGWGASRANYAAELIAERLTGEPYPQYQSAEMRFGSETESEARASYEFHTGESVVLVGFVDHPSIPMTGASPDGLVGDAGLVEFKVPNTASHIDTLLGEPIAQRYILQMHWQMACTCRKWCDFVSYDPRMPEDYRMHIQRVARSDKLIDELENDVRLFLAEIDTKLAALQGLLKVA